MHRKMITLFLTVMLMLSTSLTVSAQEYDASKTGSITLILTDPVSKQPIEDAEFEVYYIASAGINTDNQLNYIYTETFDNCGILLDDPELLTKLVVYLEENPADHQELVTDAGGKAVCASLPLGLYLIRQTNATEGYSVCTPFFVTVPIQEQVEFIYDVNASPKTDIVRLISITIQKVWNTDETSEIPGSVDIQLLCGEEVVKTATLNRDNNWKMTFSDMPESDAYEIREANVPKGFTPTYQRTGDTFTVTNTAALAQTGQLIWPVPVLAVAGMFFLMLGFVIMRKPGKKDA